MLNVGIAGIGTMGMTHYLAYQQVPGVKIRALYNRDPRRLSGDWRGIQGNFGPAGRLTDLAGISTYSEIDALLADPRLDVVDICLPSWMHARVAIDALGHGKHVFCEKPLALDGTNAERMLAAARAAGKQLLVGHVVPFMPPFAFAYQAVRGGKYGRLLGMQLKRIIADPLRLPDYYDPRKVGGPLLDLHIHDAHFIRLLCGMPKTVQSRGRMRGEVVEFVQTQFLFDDPSLVVGAAGGVIRQQGRSFAQGFEIHLERATILFDFAMIGGRPHVATPLTLLDARGKVRRSAAGSDDPADAFVAELKEMVRSIRTGKPSAILAGDLARDAVVLCQREAQSVATGRAVRI